MKQLFDVAQEIIGLFESERIEYALMGGFAVRIHALPRPTFDVDFAVAIPRERLASLFRLAMDRGYTVSEPQLNGWLDIVRGMPVAKLQYFAVERSIDVDLFLAECDYLREVISRRTRHRANGFDAWFASPEDLILLKLMSSRPRDLIDIADIYLVQGPLDDAYLDLWAGRLNVMSALATARQQAADMI